MFKRSLALVAGLSLLASTAVHAADNLIGAQSDANKTIYQIRTREVSPGLHVPAHWLVDGTGAAIGVTTNPFYVALPSGQKVELGSGTATIGTVGVNNFPSPVVGQKTKSASQPVVIASDQDALSVSVTSGGINAGTAGSPSTDVLTVQGATNGTPLPSALTPNRPATTATDTGATVTTTSSQVLAASATRGYLALINQSGTVDISCRFGTSAAVVGGAGSIDIPARATRTWGTAYLPTAAVQCVSASGSVNLTIQTN